DVRHLEETLLQFPEATLARVSLLGRARRWRLPIQIAADGFEARGIRETDQLHTEALRPSRAARGHFAGGRDHDRGRARRDGLKSPLQNHAVTGGDAAV